MEKMKLLLIYYLYIFFIYFKLRNELKKKTKNVISNDRKYFIHGEIACPQPIFHKINAIEDKSFGTL